MAKLLLTGGILDIDANGNEIINSPNVLDLYTQGNTYATGDQVVFERKVVIANKAITNAPGTFNAADWDTVDGQDYALSGVFALQGGRLADVELSLFNSRSSQLFWDDIPPGTPWRSGDIGYARSADQAASALFQFQVADGFDHVNGGRMNWGWLKTVRDNDYSGQPLTQPTHQLWDIDNRGFDIGPSYERLDFVSDTSLTRPNFTDPGTTDFQVILTRGDWSVGERMTIVSEDRTSAGIFSITAVNGGSNNLETSITRESTILNSGTAHGFWHVSPGISVGTGGGGGERASVVVPLNEETEVPAGSIAVVSAVNQYYNNGTTTITVPSTGTEAGIITFLEGETTSRVGDGDTIFTADDARTALDISDNGTTLTYRDENNVEQTFTPALDQVTFRYDVSTGDIIAFEEQTDATQVSPVDATLAALGVTGAGSIRINDIAGNPDLVGATFDVVSGGLTFPVTVVSTEDQAANETLLNLDPVLPASLPDGSTITLTLAEPDERELAGTVSRVIDVTASEITEEGSSSIFTITGLTPDQIDDITAAGLNGGNSVCIVPEGKDVRFIGSVQAPHPTNGIRFRLHTRQDDSGQTTVDSTVGSTEVLDITTAPSLDVTTDNVSLIEIIDVRDASALADIRAAAAVSNDQFIPNAFAVGDTIDIQPVAGAANLNQNTGAYEILVGMEMRFINRATSLELRGEVTVIGTEFTFRIDSIHNLPANPNTETTGLWDFVPESYFNKYTAGEGISISTDDEISLTVTPNPVETFTHRNFNVSHTVGVNADGSIGTYDQLFGITLDPVNATDGTAFDETENTSADITLASGLATAGVLLSNILESYKNGTTQVPAADIALIDAGGEYGALLEFLPVGQDLAGLFFVNDGSDVWTMNNGFFPAQTVIPSGTPYRLRYFARNIPVFNNPRHVPYAGVVDGGDSGEGQVDRILELMTGVAPPFNLTQRVLPADNNLVVTTTYTDTSGDVSTLATAATKSRDIFGFYLDIEIDTLYNSLLGSGSFLYNPAIDSSIVLSFEGLEVPRDRTNSASVPGGIEVDGKIIQVPGVLDLNNNEFVGGVLNRRPALEGGTDTITTHVIGDDGLPTSRSATVSGVGLNAAAIQRLESGGGGGGDHQHTANFYSFYPYPGSVNGTWANDIHGGDLRGLGTYNNATVNPAFSQHRVGLANNTTTPINNVVRSRNYWNRNVGTYQRFSSQFRPLLRRNVTELRADGETSGLFRRLELLFRQGHIDPVLGVQGIGNGSQSGGAGFSAGVSDNQAAQLIYQPSDNPSENRIDLLLTFVTSASGNLNVNIQHTIGLTRVSTGSTTDTTSIASRYIVHTPLPFDLGTNRAEAEFINMQVFWIGPTRDVVGRLQSSLLQTLFSSPGETPVFVGMNPTATEPNAPDQTLFSNQLFFYFDPPESIGALSMTESAEIKTGWDGISRQAPNALISVNYSPFQDGSGNDNPVGNLLTNVVTKGGQIDDASANALVQLDYASLGFDGVAGTIPVNDAQLRGLHQRLAINLTRTEDTANLAPRVGTAGTIDELFAESGGAGASISTLLLPRSAASYPMPINPTWFSSDNTGVIDGQVLKVTTVGGVPVSVAWEDDTASTASSNLPIVLLTNVAPGLPVASGQFAFDQTSEIFYVNSTASTITGVTITNAPTDLTQVGGGGVETAAGVSVIARDVVMYNDNTGNVISPSGLMRTTDNVLTGGANIQSLTLENPTSTQGHSNIEMGRGSIGQSSLRMRGTNTNISLEATTTSSVTIDNLATTSPGTGGQVWNNNGVLNIGTGGASATTPDNNRISVFTDTNGNTEGSENFIYNETTGANPFSDVSITNTGTAGILLEGGVLSQLAIQNSVGSPNSLTVNVGVQGTPGVDPEQTQILINGLPNNGGLQGEVWDNNGSLDIGDGGEFQNMRISGIMNLLLADEDTANTTTLDVTANTSDVFTGIRRVAYLQSGTLRGASQWYEFEGLGINTTTNVIEQVSGSSLYSMRTGTSVDILTVDNSFDF